MEAGDLLDLQKNGAYTGMFLYMLRCISFEEDFHF